LRVLQVGSSLIDWGGIERYIVYLQQGLQAKGIDCDVTCPANSPLAQRLSSHLPLRVKAQFDPRALAAYLKLFRRQKYDIVHIHFSPDFVMPALAAHLTGQKTVLTRHVSLPWSESKVKRYLRLFDHIIPVSNSVQSKLLASGVPASRMTVAKAGTPALQAPTKMDLGGGYRVGSFGRFVKEKGLITLIKAAENSDFQVDLFGNGPLETQLKGIAAPNVTFRGFVEDVAAAMSAVDVVAIPSIWDEAFPYSALEAMSLGKPIVASDVGGIPEVVTLSTGRLVPKEDIKALKDAIEELADPSLRQRLGDNARELHRSEYTVERMAERIAAVYGTITGKGTF